MDGSGGAFGAAWQLVVSLDSRLGAIALLSLKVSVTAVLAATVIGLPIGAILAVGTFPGRKAATIAINALMGLPSVVAGLGIYLLLSRSGPLGALGLLFTPEAMAIAQAVLITPLVAALSRQIIEGLWLEYKDLMRGDGLNPLQSSLILLRIGRFALVTALLAGLGRALGEVGAALMVGGNIAGLTETMTTAISTATRQGDLVVEPQ